jgi:hypothetical protein
VVRNGVDFGRLGRFRLDLKSAEAIARLGFRFAPDFSLGGELLTSQAANDVFGDRRKGLENARIFGCNGLEYSGSVHVEFSMQLLERIGIR